MTARIFALVPAMVLTLGTATALAHPTERLYAQCGQASLMYHNALHGAYGQSGTMAENAAFVSDGSTPGYLQEQREVRHEPGYSVGTGAAEVGVASAYIGDGSDPNYVQDKQWLEQEYGYSSGNGAARVGGAF